MKHRRLRNFLIFVIVLVVIFVGGYFGINAYSHSLVKSKNTEAGANKNNPHPLIDNTLAEEYKKSLEAEPSDIEGMTKLDKYNKGLSVKDGSDTDRDGLTDKDEIGTYKSDPHKKSTAGDLYTDGYKVKNGMDVHTKYDRDPSEIAYPNNTSTDISLKAETIDDADARIVNVTDVYEDLAVPAENYFKWASEYTIYRDYEVHGFTGTLTVDVSAIIAENEGLQPKHLRVLISTDPGYQTLKETSYEIDGNKLTPDVKKVNSSGNFLMVIARKSLTGNVAADVRNSKAVKALAGAFSADSNPLDASGDALLSNRFGILGSLRIVHPVIYYVPYSDEEKTESMLNGMVSMGNQCTDAEDFVTRADCRQVSREELAAKRALYEKFFPDCEVFYSEGYKVKSSDATLKQMVVFSYINYDEGLSEFAPKEIEDTSDEPLTPGEKTAEIRGDFLGTETIPFKNFGSNISPGGNCVGFSLFTMTLHNKGVVPAEGSYQFNEEIANRIGTNELYWNITQDDNRTLLDWGLSDYKDAYWTENHTDSNYLINYDSLSDSEEQFVNMIGCYWRLGNDRCRGYFNYNYDENYVTTETIYNITSMLDQGKVVEWASALYDGGKREEDGVTFNTLLGYHSMLLYDYEMKVKECTAVDGEKVMCNVFYFKVYDCNYPQNNTTNILTMIEAPGQDYLSYLYNPDPEHNGPVATDYKFTEELQSTGFFEVSDEDFNDYTCFGVMPGKEDEGDS